MPKFISFVCQKGGVGKSTLTKITAAYFNERGVKVLVMDSDYPQHVLAKQRTQDLLDLTKTGLELPTEQELAEWGIKPFPISDSDVATTSHQMSALSTSEEYQFVFVDLPGTLNVEGIAGVLKKLDIIIIPCEWDVNNVRAAMETVVLIRKVNETVPIGFLWSRPDKVHSEKNRKDIEAIIYKRLKVYFFKFIAYKNASIKSANTLNLSPKIFHPFITELADFMNNYETQP